MIISGTAVHGMQALCHLSRQPVGSVLSSEAIGAALGITAEHASKVLKRLATAGVLASTRGRHGGYTLVRRLDEVLVTEVLDALHPARNKTRSHAQNCTTADARLCNAHLVLLRLEDRLRETLAGETLGRLAGSACAIADACVDSDLACRSKGAGKLIAAS